MANGIQQPNSSRTSVATYSKTKSMPALQLDQEQVLIYFGYTNKEKDR